MHIPRPMIFYEKYFFQSKFTLFRPKYVEMCCRRNIIYYRCLKLCEEWGLAGFCFWLKKWAVAPSRQAPGFIGKIGLKFPPAKNLTGKAFPFLWNSIIFKTMRIWRPCQLIQSKSIYLDDNFRNLPIFYIYCFHFFNLSIQHSPNFPVYII